MRRPVNSPYTITQEFGVPDSYAKFGRHSGVDYAVPSGRAVFAPKGGSLTNVVSQTGGNMVVIFDGQFWHRLMHNSSFSRSNGRVNEGEEVAKAGSTGLSTGPHVHWDINKEGTYPTSFAAFIDPAKWLAGEYETKLQPNQRILSNPDGVNQREQPNTSSKIMKEWPFDQEPFTFKGYVKGETVSGNNIWFVGGISGGYFWSGAFQGGSNTAGLSELSNTSPVPPQPQPTPPPTFTKELACVTKVVQAYYSSDPTKSNYEIGNFPAKPTGVVLHDFGTDAKDTLQSSLNHFANPDTTAPHFTVSGSQIIQNVSLKNRAYHAGPRGNDKVGVEIDPDVDTNPATKASVELLVKQLQEYYKAPLKRHLHSEFMATSCGDDITKAGLMNPAPPPTSDLETRVKALEDKLSKVKGIL